MEYKRFMNILRVVYTEPWLIRPEMHDQICKIVDAHMDGSAHEEAGIALMFDGGEEESIMEKEGDVAYININGVIAKGLGVLEKTSGMVDVDEIEECIMDALLDSSINTIALNIDSPGGTVSGVPELAKFIEMAKGEKKVVAYTGGLMASAAYWLGSQASVIVASETATVGSIGVYLALLDSSRAYEMNGYKREVIKGGKYKGIGIEGTSLTDEQRAFLQDRVDFLHVKFKTAVRAGRGNMSDDVMQGQDFFGDQAAAVNLVDVVGTMQDAINLAKLGE